jgi:uncharacterized membrane protein YqiK
MEFQVAVVVAVAVVIVVLGLLIAASKWYRKTEQGKVFIRNGINPTVSFTGVFVIPIIHRLEIMDISVKRIEISRMGKEGLTCKDNMRADIKVAFFVRVNNEEQAVRNVAQSIGCDRASDPNALIELFDAKFSEALKTVGKKFDFVDLYNARKEFKEEIIQIIGTDLNGYVLEDCAIDYLEQTRLENLDANNILDAQGIKKITELTADQAVLSNQIAREKEKTIKQQDVQAEEAVLELDRQLEESREKQKREVASVKAREEAEILRIQQEELRKSEAARLATEEEVQVAEENKQRQVIVAQKNKERTEAIEQERIEKDRSMEAIERERVTELAKIAKEKSLEEERKNIQDVIRDRVAVEKAVVEEEEKIKDTKAHSEAARSKHVALVAAEQFAEEEKIKTVKSAEAERTAAEEQAKKKMIEAEAALKAADKEAEARKVIAEASAAEEATKGMAEVHVMEAKAKAKELDGTADASVIERRGIAESKAMQARAEGLEKEGMVKAIVAERQAEADAKGISLRAEAEAEGIRKKADAMKQFDGEGREHEEFKLRLLKDEKIELAAIDMQQRLAQAQAEVLREGLSQASIEIIGGESMFFDKIAGAVSQGKAIDRMVGQSEVLQDVKNTFFTGNPDDFKANLAKFLGNFPISSEDLKNLTVTAALTRWMNQASDDKSKGIAASLLEMATGLGIGDRRAADFLK